ncbi:MAG: hypothetical protein N2484_09735 [Clostridia bacterium]|nr:hypothetical protein [Clostridia bacterium]
MRVIARVYKWILISVILQLLILLFFNNYFFARKGEVKVTSIDTEGVVKEDLNVKLPSGAADVKVSFDASFAAYLIDGRLEILDLQKKKNKETIKHEGDSISYFKWLPDRNMLIYAEKSTGDEKVGVKVTSHNVDSGDNTSYPPILKLSKQSEVVDIELSPLTNVVYIKLKTSDTNASIYKYNINNNLSHVMSTSIDTEIKETNYSDKLIYQDNKKRVFVNDSIKGKTWQIPFKNKVAILGLDSEDKPYIGELNKENKVFKIHMGKLTDSTLKSWSQISLERPLPVENILLSPDDIVYELNAEQNMITDVQSGKKVEYKGKYIEIIKGYVVSLNGNELRLKVIK